MDPKFVVNLSGKDHVLYAGLLAEAHERGLQSIETQLIQIPAEENGNTAIARAVVRLKDGTFFEEYGDASPKNVNARIATALIRMALTRAKGRALRDAVNVGQAMVEELPDLDEQPSRYGARADQAVTEAAARGRATMVGAERAREAVAAGERPLQVTTTEGEKPAGCETCGVVLTPGQVNVSTRNYGKALCPSCQKTALDACKKAEMAA